MRGKKIVDSCEIEPHIDQPTAHVDFEDSASRNGPRHDRVIKRVEARAFADDPKS